MNLSTFAFPRGLLSALRLFVFASSVFGAQAFAQVDDYAEVNRLIKAGQMSEALAKADQYLAARPRDPQMRFLKGVVLSESGKPGDAIAVFTKLTEDYPELPEPYNNLAVLYANQNQFDKARSSLEMAIRTNPSYATAHENLGDVYARLASQAYSKALQLDGNAAVQPKLGLIRNIFNPESRGQKPVAAAPVTPSMTPPSVARVPAPAVALASPASTPSAARAPASAVPPVAAVAAAPAAQVPSPGPAAPNAAATDAQQEVDRAVRRWAAAWAEQDMTEYLAAYGSNFQTPGKQARSAWEAERRARIVGKKRITVDISNLNIQVNGNQAKARFRQQYSADSLNVTSQKTLDLVKSANRWVIVRETVGS